MTETLRQRGIFPYTQLMDGTFVYNAEQVQAALEAQAAQIEALTKEVEVLQSLLEKQIDYQQLIADCYRTTKQPQGSKGCIAFARGAEWWRAQISGAAIDAAMAAKEPR